VTRVFAWLSSVDACFDYRVRLPLTELGKRPGWDCSWGPPPLDIADYDVVIGQRLAGPQPDWLALCKDPNVLCVYDADDDLTDLDPENTVPYSIYAPLADDTRTNMAAADVVTCCVPAAAERIARDINPRVVVLPICADPAWIDLPMRTRPDVLTVGWAGSPFHAQDWGSLPTHLAEYARRVPHATWHAMGADYSGGAFGGRTRVTGLQPLPAYLAAVDFDIGVAPLNTALRGSRTRSWTKALEYGCRGVPVVAQACGQYLDWVQEGVNGFLVRDEAEWVDHLVALSDVTVRAPMSTAARDRARQQTIDRHIHLWERTYRGELP
jgi:glycosyltransferase involved in cell wall biosynthesis